MLHLRRTAQTARRATAFTRHVRAASAAAADTPLLFTGCNSTEFTYDAPSFKVRTWQVIRVDGWRRE